jgi:hypothetical protein
MTAPQWTIGDEVAHRKFGIGRILAVDGDTVTVQFDAGKPKRIRTDFLWPPDADLSDPTTRGWPGDTFVQDSPDAQHYPGSRWSPFNVEARLVIEQLPKIVPAARVQDGYSSFDSHKAPRKVPDDWPQGFQMCWPDAERGISLVLKMTDEANLIVNLFPFAQHGCQTLLRIERVTVWQSGLEAQITASWGDAEVTFFDTRHVIDRAHYVKGWHYEFILNGLAYGAGPAIRQDRPLLLSPGAVANLNRHLPQDMQVEQDATMSLEGTAWLLPVEDLDIDDYHFRGPTTSVQPFKDWLGQDGWRVRTTVMRFSGSSDMQDANLDIHITRKVWSGDEAPQVGQDIEGLLWLQGHLWTPMLSR